MPWTEPWDAPASKGLGDEREFQRSLRMCDQMSVSLNPVGKPSRKNTKSYFHVGRMVIPSEFELPTMDMVF